MLRLVLGVSVVASLGCSNLVVIRASSNDFLKKKATSVLVPHPPQTVMPVIDELFQQRGYMRQPGQRGGENGSQLFFYRGPRALPPELSSYNLQLGSWYVARVTPAPTGTEVTLAGKPMIGQQELCNDWDKLLADIQYQCVDTRVAPDWPGMNLISGRDESEVVSWVLTGLYERLKR
jgi:hypothetical protein